MRRILLIFLIMGLGSKSHSQGIPDGLWNAGGIYPPRVLTSQRGAEFKWKNATIMVNLYQGFAVVKSVYSLYNDDSIVRKATVLIADSGTMSDPATMEVHTKPSSAIRVYVNDSLVSDKQSDAAAGRYEMIIEPKQTLSLRIYQITQNNEAKLYREADSRTGNAFAVYCAPGALPDSGSMKVLVNFMDPLTMTSVLGVSPAKKTEGDLTHLQYDVSKSVMAPLVIWYEGAAPDFNFNKKVLPAADQLFLMMDKFSAVRFHGNAFNVIDRYNFSTNPKNPLAAILYFIMFSVPWLILGGFIIFLLRRPRHKNQSDEFKNIV